MLALSDNLHFALAAFQLFFSAAVSISIVRLTAWQRRYEGLEQRLHEATAKLVEQRFQSITREVDGHVNALVISLDEMKSRIQHGDGELRSLFERDQKLEVALGQRLEMLKDWIRDYAAGKDYLDKREAHVETKLSTVEQRLLALAADVAVLTSRG